MKLLLFGMVLPLAACNNARPANYADALPKVLSDEVPFRYPMQLYEQGIEGDVTLRLHVDTSGAVIAESLRIEESSGQPLLDLAALQGATGLRFSPARRGGRAVPLTILFPVRFRVPAGNPAPADSDGAVPGQ